MKKILIYVLLLTNLCSGVAFAWDAHPEAVAGHDAVMVDLASDGDHEHPDGDLHHAEHCCHGASHLIGIFITVTTPVMVANRDHSCFLPHTLPPLYITPLLRPPIV